MCLIFSIILYSVMPQAHQLLPHQGNPDALPTTVGTPERTCTKFHIVKESKRGGHVGEVYDIGPNRSVCMLCVCMFVPVCCFPGSSWDPQLQLRQQQLEGELAAKQQQAGDLVKDFKAVEDQVDKVRGCGLM